MNYQFATLGSTVYFFFAANDTGGSGADGATPLADVRLAGGAADAAPVLSPTPTLLSHANYPAGCHEVAVAATAANNFTRGSTYAVFCTLAVDSQNPSGFLGSFALASISPGWTLSGSYYCDRDSIEDVFGNDNVERWADLDNDDNATNITNRIVRATVVATAYIDSFCKGTRYILPLADSSDNVPIDIVDLASKWAGVWLYESRGIEDFSPDTGKPTHRLAAVKAEVEQAMEDIRAGKRRIDAL